MSHLAERVCPECGGKMEVGQITAMHSFRWVPKDQRIPFFLIFAERPTPWRQIWTHPRLPACRCRLCQTILAKYRT